MLMIDLDFPKRAARRASLPIPLLETGVLLVLVATLFILS